MTLFKLIIATFIPITFSLADSLKKEDLPPNVAQKVDAVRPLCVCDTKPTNCVTMTNVLRPEKFVTNVHAFQYLLMKKHWYETITGKACPVDFLTFEDKKKEVPLKVKVLKAGSVFPKTMMKVDEFDHRFDLILLDINLKGTPLRFAQEIKLEQIAYHLGFSDSDEEPKGDNPLVPTLTLATGPISEIKPHNVSVRFKGFRGSSGGAVVDAEGKLLGIFWGRKKGEAPLSYFIPFQAVQAFLEVEG